MEFRHSNSNPNYDNTESLKEAWMQITFLVVQMRAQADLYGFGPLKTLSKEIS